MQPFLCSEVLLQHASIYQFILKCPRSSGLFLLCLSGSRDLQTDLIGLLFFLFLHIEEIIHRQSLLRIGSFFCLAFVWLNRPLWLRIKVLWSLHFYLNFLQKYTAQRVFLYFPPSPCWGKVKQRESRKRRPRRIRWISLGSHSWGRFDSCVVWAQPLASRLSLALWPVAFVYSGPRRRSPSPARCQGLARRSRRNQARGPKGEARPRSTNRPKYAGGRQNKQDTERGVARRGRISLGGNPGLLPRKLIG